jgi:hypothetical protein
MKRVFVCFEQHLDKNGKPFVDDDGCTYLKPHSNPLLAGREFANVTEILTVIIDHNNANPTKKFVGEFIPLEKYSFGI